MPKTLNRKTFFERAAEAAVDFLKDPLLPWVGAGGAESIADTYIAIHASSFQERYLMKEYLMGAWLVSEVRSKAVNGHISASDTVRAQIINKVCGCGRPAVTIVWSEYERGQYMCEECIALENARWGRAVA